MFLQDLSGIPGVSGNENEVRKYIRKALPSRIKADVDYMGNLLVNKDFKGNSSACFRKIPRIMLAAHMDEVGLMISSIEKTGHLRFKKVGGIDDRVLVAKDVLVGKDCVPGVIGAKAVHLQKEEERKRPYEVKSLFIDIGVQGKEEAEKLVQIGDYVSFDSSFKSMGDNCYMGKAFDDRVGCAILLEMLHDHQKELPPFQAAFTVQEEVGFRGARTAAYALNPEIALVIEGTAASDVPESKDHEHSTTLGEGPAITFMDQSVMVDRELMQRLVNTAEKNEIPFQFRRFTGGFTDAGAISLAREGTRTAVISVPCRYIHSPFSILKESDYRHTLELVRAFLKSFIV